MIPRNIRYAVRTLLASPGFTAAAVLCLSLGIGINASVFSVVDGVLLQPFPFPEADRIIVVDTRNVQSEISQAGLSYPDFKDWRDQNQTLATMAAFTGRSLTIADGASDPERYAGSNVSWTLFGLLGTPPALGRDFGPEDDRPAAEPVVILGHEIWQQRYGGDASILGRSISLNGVPSTVIGVMPPRFQFPQNQKLWVPIAPFYERTRRDERGLQVFARMKPGVTRDRAATDLDGIASRLAAAYPEQNTGWSATTGPLREWMIPVDVEVMILSMMGAVTLVLLIACANIANLLIARASVRQREISIRTALGAGRARIVGQLLTESVVIGALSVPLGIFFGWVGVKLIDLGIPPDSIPYYIRWALDWRSIVYTTAIALTTGVLFGLAPALQAARLNLQETLKEGGRGSTGGRRAWLRNSLVVAEVAMSLVLLVGASLFVRSVLNLQSARVGFDTAPLMTLRFYLPGVAYERGDAKARRVEDIVRRVETLPGVDAAFASNFIPLGGGGGGGTVAIEGRAVARGEEASISLIAVTTGLSRTLDVPVVRGRDFTRSEDITRTAVAIVNLTMADRLWPGADAVGRRFRMINATDGEWFTIVGVVADFRHGQGTETEPVAPAAYVPYSFGPALNTGLTIRVAGDASRVTSAVREQIRQSDPALPVFQARTMEENRQRSFWELRLFGWMFTVFGVAALLLASVGVYGVLSYSVSQRTQEIGVRIALGARRQDVLRLIVGHGLRLAAIGIALGLVASPFASQAIQNQLYNVSRFDPVSFGVVSAFLAVAALLASYLPARRALAVDPIVALRES